MKRLLLFFVTAICGLSLNAQLLTWTPLFPKENDPNQNLVITVDDTKGNQGLLNYTGDVYVHIGVITNLSANSGDWKYVPFQWGTTTAAAKTTSLGNNKWQYTINGSLRTFFGITNSAETIKKIAILFRSGAGDKKQANADGGDMYIPVYPDNTLAVRIDQPATQPKYTPVPEPQNWTVGTSFTIIANASQPSTMTLFHNGTVIAGPTSNVQTLTGNSTVAAIGNQQIVAEASDGTTTTYDTLNVFVSPGGSPTQPLPAGVRDGINYEPGDTSVILVLRAPHKNLVTVIGDFNNWTEGSNYIMNKTPDGKFFWIRIHGLTPGTEYAYQYVVDNNLKIADPYAEKILDPSNDQFIPASTYPNLKPYPTGQTGIVSVLQTAAPAYNWSVNNFNRPDKRSLVIYELLVRDFVAAHDWNTVKDSLNYLKNLGVNAIEVMPFNEFEGNDSWGYNPDFYFAPDKYYGPKNSLKEFIDSCHKKGIAVIMDIALNHSFGSSPMVQLYWDTANNRPAASNPWFNPVAKHAFNVGYDMNHESLDTKYFVGRVVENWLQQYKLDGFRFDLSKGFTQKQTCDNTGNNCDVNAWGNYDSSRVTIWKGYYDTVQSKSTGAYAILEHFAVNQEEKDLSNYGMMPWGNMAFNYQEASRGNLASSDLSYGIYSSPSRGWTNPYLVTYMESHDEERIVYRNEQAGNSSAGYNIKDTATALKRMELAASFLFTIPGPKMLWQFGELGYDYSINRCANGTVDPGCRLVDKPIRWDFLNDPRRKEVHDVYSNLINLRFHPWYKDAFMTGAISQNVGNNVAVKWISVTTDTSKLLVLGNFDVNVQFATITFPTSGTWYDYLNNSIFTATGTAQSITLQPGEYHVYLNRNVNNNSATPVTDVPWNGSTLEAKVYPNPVSTDFTLEINVPQSGNGSISLYNTSGQFVTTLYKGFLQKGTKELILHKPNASTGSYYIKIDTKTATKTIKVTLQ
jgi:1,4-alpha-glucan branching enzyme